MKKALIIVESPTKIKTLKKFLGPEYSFESSLGHIRDLPKKGFGIDIQNDFEPQYALLDEKKEVIQRLKKAAKEADIIYLSPDPDREGEAIAWHILSILPKDKEIKRVTFNAITKEAVLQALKSPREIDQGLVDAQQARRLLDRIVGYKISPILMRRVRRAKGEGGLSAGRVQSVALKLVVDRERAIDAFIPVEYWNVLAELQGKKSEKSFTASLFSVDGKKVEKEKIDGKEVFLIPNKQVADKLLSDLTGAVYIVDSVDKKEKRRNPVAPFTTSTLQQEASRHHGFSATRTMSTAQGLYEGVELGSKGSEGLITYMRTDSVRAAPEAIDAVRAHIGKTFGKEYLPQEARQYFTKKNAQDAHEAIRPTNLNLSPDSIKQYLTQDQWKLYSLIWKRFIASQMSSAIYDTVSCDIKAGSHMIFRATGSTLKFPGFLSVYIEKRDQDSENDEESKMLPPLDEGQVLQALNLHSDQSFTKPPPRFTEASLVKELEKSGIGRPSTYATIMQKIQSRDYTNKEKGTLIPTELGKIIAQLLESNFKLIMDLGFTAAMEDNLESVAEHKIAWKSLITDFWKDFIPTVELAEKDAHVPKVLTDMDCPLCGKKLQKIWAHNKYFYGCSDYPECKYTTSSEALDFNKSDYDPNFNWDQVCSKCSSPMQIKFGRFGVFLGCTNYPECKTIVNIAKKDDVPFTALPSCPAIGCEGKLTQRRSRFGKTFFSCSEYPDCNVIVNDLSEIEKKYQNHPKTPYVKSAKPGRFAKKEKPKAPEKPKKTAKKAVKKKSDPKAPKSEKKGSSPVKISQDLQQIVGEGEFSRPQLIKQVWDYIKTKDLQDPKNKRKIVPDEKLSKIFGSKEPLDMMQLSKVIYKQVE